MASVAERREPRYGSAAELAAYAGVSPKTIRRLVDAGKVRGLKLGRRLVIPFQDVDDHILGAEKARRPTMPATLTRAAFDARGRALPLPADEESLRRAEALRALDELAAMGDDEEQRETFAALVEAIDGDRMSDRKRFAE
jgi:excisionase family DNA binding protein